MYLAGVTFTLASVVDGTRTAAGDLVLETPHERFNNVRGLPLNKYGLGPFTRLRLSRLPKTAGVYLLVRGDDEILYVGRARDSIAFRWGPNGYAAIHPRNCFKGGQNTNCRINQLLVTELQTGAKLSLWTHVTPDPDSLELRLIAELQPSWNIQGRTFS